MSETDIDLSDIDALCTAPTGGRLMDAIYDQMLDDTGRRKLRAACGLEPGIRRRQWTAVSKWLNRTLDVDDKVTAKKVAEWARSHDG